MISKGSSSSIRVLGVALLLHQFFEGVSLGIAVLTAPVSKRTQLKFAMVFAMSLPIGGVVGLMVSSASEQVEVGGHGMSVVVQGVSNALAAGILIYTSLVEMLPKEFGSEHHHHDSSSVGTLKEGASVRDKCDCVCGVESAKYIALWLGFLSMSLLAVWA